MDNIFTTLANTIPKPKAPQPETQPQAAAPLNKRTMQDLVSMYQKGDKSDELSSELLRRLKPTISSAISSYAPGKDRELAIRAASMAMDSLKTYDPGFGTDPKTHVFNNLKRLSRIGAQRGNIVKVSESAAYLQRDIQKAIDKFNDDYGREPSMEELADITGVSEKRIENAMGLRRAINESATLSEDSKRDRLASSDLDDSDYFEYVYRSVGPIDQKIMEWSSGMHGVRRLSNNEIARRLRMTPSAISQRKAKIQYMLSDVRGLL